MNSVERAADWLFSHADDLDGATAAVNGSGQAVASKVENDDGVGECGLLRLTILIHTFYIPYMNLMD